MVTYYDEINKLGNFFLLLRSWWEILYIYCCAFIDGWWSLKGLLYVNNVILNFTLYSFSPTHNTVLNSFFIPKTSRYTSFRFPSSIQISSVLLLKAFLGNSCIYIQNIKHNSFNICGVYCSESWVHRTFVSLVFGKDIDESGI